MRRLFLAVMVSFIASTSYANNHAPIVRTITLDVAGMSCEPCAVNVEAALMNLPEIASAKVDVASSTAVVALKDINGEPSEADLNKAIDAAGYTLKAVHY